ncbi:sensor histidine kinase [Streptococcus respiraculi]|uniref:sensor histidine kinase n=1 Tax=Streptococcus respiraculi TaxID=2021971 RepID=UPI000E72C161|nr:sensor histidine kinase [Streptococcus respiraculi]
MTRRKIGFFIKHWLTGRFLFMVGVLIFLGLITSISSLFNVETALTVYTSLLLMVLGLALVAIDLFREWQRYALAESGHDIVTGTATEVVLQERINQLEEALKVHLDHARERQSDVQDYYTLWAHQMKIPIAASQLLIADLSASEEKQALERELFKIEQYTGLVLNYLRLQSFHEDLVVERESLETLVRQVVKKFSIFFIQQKIELRLDRLELALATDKKWFCLLLEQFISNAIKYTTGGQIWIYLDGDELVIQDTGIGIAKSDIKRIFDRGFSGYNGRISQQSSGLGLYLARQISQKLGLRFSLTSEVGQGTQVRIFLKEESLVID